MKTLRRSNDFARRVRGKSPVFTTTFGRGSARGAGGLRCWSTSTLQLHTACHHLHPTNTKILSKVKRNQAKKQELAQTESLHRTYCSWAHLHTQQGRHTNHFLSSVHMDHDQEIITTQRHRMIIILPTKRKSPKGKNAM